MANISSLLEIIRTAHLGRDMRQALHDAIEDVNDDTETALGKTLAFNDTTRKLTLKAKDNSVLSEATIPGGASGSTVTWNQIKQSGEKIATITIDETTTDVYASAGGGGGGGAVDTVNGIAPDENGNVTVDADHISDTSTTNKFVTATEKSTWNGKQNALTFTSTPSSSNKVVCEDDLPSGGGHTIKNESGTALTQRDNLQFKGCSVSDDSTNNATVVSVQTSNRNLLDNAWFTVNQKGFTSKTSSSSEFNDKFMDRWKANWFAGYPTQIVLNSDDTLSLKINKNSTYGTTAREIRILQEIEDYEKLIGKQCTMSIMLADGTIYSATKIVPSTGQAESTTTFATGKKITFAFDNRNSGMYKHAMWVRFQITSDIYTSSDSYEELKIKAIKLELGSQSTLAFDTAPDYATELLKCQRYLQPINAYTVLCRSPRVATTWWGVWNLPVPFRATPTLSVTSKELDLFTSSSYAEELNPTINMTNSGNVINLVVQSTASGKDGSSATLMLTGGWLDAQL